MFTLLMVSFTGFVLSKPAVTVDGRRIVLQNGAVGNLRGNRQQIAAVALRKT
jgi:hypothetical protein